MEDFEVERILRKKTTFLSPVIKLIRLNSRLAILKDYSEKGTLEKIIGKLLVYNEYRILKRLENICVAPKPVAIKNNVLMTTFIEGEHIDKIPSDKLNESIYFRLEAIIEKMHKRGVFHLDIGQRRNIIISRDGTPYLLDFANAVCLRQSPPWSILTDILRIIDIRGLLKLKNRYFLQLMTKSDKKHLKHYNFLRYFWI
jgi:RIO-like serine/threonine protein kinase